MNLVWASGASCASTAQLTDTIDQIDTLAILMTMGDWAEYPGLQTLTLASKARHLARLAPIFAESNQRAIVRLHTHSLSTASHQAFDKKITSYGGLNITIVILLWSSLDQWKVSPLTSPLYQKGSQHLR